MNLKKGFTLAEVLIALVIIGIIAAITVPTVMNNINKKQYIVAWRKAYSDVANALLLIKANNDYFDLSANSEEEIINKLSKYMSNTKICSANNFDVEGCGTNYPIYKHSGSKYADNMGTIGGGARCMIITNGTLLCFDAMIGIFDVNGSRKPNTIGKDIFFALVDRTNYKLNPAKGHRWDWGPADGILQSYNAGNGTCQNSDNGDGCSVWYLYHDE